MEKIAQIEHGGATYTMMSPAELKGLGVPQAVIDEAVGKLRVGHIKQECRRIYAIANAESQMNMATASAVISGKTAPNRTDAEKVILSGTEMAIEWVAAMRANIATLADDENANITDDANWPACPAEVTALAAMF
ncbi:hypothetical protein [Maritalea sp.]|uniref:hypothetical protein n=1 Tax=Maritalea sp. TaxID=2003361 RepID=UPI003EF7FEC2